jgi:hypothetical protein
MTIAERLSRGKRVGTGQGSEMGVEAAGLQGLRRKVPRDGILIAILVLASTGSFGLGVMAGQEGSRGGGGEKVSIQGSSAAASAPAAATDADVSQKNPAVGSSDTKSEEPDAGAKKPSVPSGASGGQYVASKTGTKYYLPWCGTAKRIKDDNKVWFASKAEAEAAGYEPAKNCKGI